MTNDMGQSSRTMSKTINFDHAPSRPSGRVQGRFIDGRRFGLDASATQAPDSLSKVSAA